MSTYYMETRRWGKMTPQSRKDIMEKFEYIKRASMELPPRTNLTMEIFKVYPVSPKTIQGALILRAFNERILEHAFHVLHYHLDLTPEEKAKTSLKDYVIARVTKLDDDDEW